MKIREILKTINPYNKIKQVNKQLKIAYDALLRPFNPFTLSSPNTWPATHLAYSQLYNLAYDSDILSIVHRAIRTEILRNGYDLFPALDANENVTNSEQDITPTGHPNDINTVRMQTLNFLENINQNGQNVLDVMHELEDDLSIVDNAFALFSFDYGVDEQTGEIDIKETKLSEILRVNPTFIGMMINERDMLGFDNEMNKLTACPQHRSQLLTGQETCPICGYRAYQVCYYHQWGDKVIYYYKNEIVHMSKYRPSKRGGYPPLFTLAVKSETLYFMDTYMQALYDKRRPPRAGLFFGTNNLDSLQVSIEKARQKSRADPHFPLVMGIENVKNSKSFVEYIDFMKSLQDLQFTDVRDEMRRIIGAFYGVSPIFQGDVSTSGGLNNEGLQVTVTNRAVEIGQRLYNNKFFPKILEDLKLVGWTLMLNPSEEQDEMARLQRQQISFVNGAEALRMGLEAEYDEDQGEVVIHSGTLTKPVDMFSPGSDPSNNQPSPPSTDSSLLGGEPLSSSKSALLKVGNRVPFTSLANKIKAEIDKFLKIYKRKPSTKELTAAMTKINQKLVTELLDSSKRSFKTTYSAAMAKVEKEMGINLVFGKVDQNALSILANQPVLTTAYSGIASQLTQKINEILTMQLRNPAGISLQNIQSALKETIDLSDFRAETIARTEMSKVSAAARLNQYKKEDDFSSALFSHIGPADSRTTATSKRIKERTKNGVSWDQYIDIVMTESKKDFPTWQVNPNFPVSHWNTRHSFSRIN